MNIQILQFNQMLWELKLLDLTWDPQTAPNWTQTSAEALILSGS